MQFFLTFQGKKYLFLLKTIDFMNKFDKKKFLIYISSAGGQKPVWSPSYNLLLIGGIFTMNYKEREKIAINATSFAKRDMKINTCHKFKIFSKAIKKGLIRQIKAY